MIWVGNKAYIFEMRVIYRAKHPFADKNEKLEFPQITDDQAFGKGVEYFVEILVLYGVIGAVSMNEVLKSIKASKKLTKELKFLESRNVV